MKACLLFVLAAGCASDPWQPNFDETRTLPGPTRAHVGSDFDFEYDDHDRLVKVSHLVGTDQGALSESSEWTYDATGKLASILVTSPDQIIGTSTALWKLDVQPIELYTGSRTPYLLTATYDPATFAFLPTPGVDLVNPRAELGKMSVIDTSGGDPILYSWTTVGNVRTSRSTNGHVATYTFDEHDRLISIVDDLGNFGAERTRTFEYEGDHLVRTTHSEGLPIEYRYDLGGNLVQSEWSHGSSRVTGVYLYDGW